MNTAASNSERVNSVMLMPYPLAVLLSFCGRVVSLLIAPLLTYILS
jgi:hypothetical protein